MRRIAEGRRSARRGRWRVTWTVAPVAALVVLAGACTGEPTRSGRSTAATDSGTSVVAHPVDESITPLVITPVGFDPIPVKGSDDKFHVAYEISVLNYHPDAAVITSVDTVSPDGRVVTSWSQQQIQALTMVLPDLTQAGAPAGIPPGGTGILVLDDVYPDRASIPRTVTHRISATFTAPAGAPAARVALFPAQVTETGGPVTISAQDPVVLGAPMVGAGWVVGFGCCDKINGHRGAILPVGSAINGTERFGIDFGRFRSGVGPGSPLTDDVLFKPGTDGKKNEDYVSYGAPLLAVADATVVKVVEGVPDTAPGAAPGGEEGLDINDVGGNVVVLQLAPDLFAFYLHNEPGSTTVKVGDKVTKGQQVARLGSSGNSLSPHLHFQLGRSPQMLAAENVPYEFEAFVLQGTFTDTTVKAEPTPGPRHDEFPLDQNLLDFPASP